MRAQHKSQEEAVSEENVVSIVPQKKEVVRVVTKNGWWLDFDKLDNFSMVQFITGIRAQGYLLNDRVYITHDEIQSIFIYDKESPPQQMGAVVPFPPRPA
jgi:hypothetical protein